MTHLQQVDPASTALHLDLSRKSGIAGKQGLKAAILYQQHQRIFIQILAPMRPAFIGVEDTEAHAVEREALSAGTDMPGNCLTRELVEEGVIQRVGHWFARLDHNPGPVPLQDTDAMASKERNYHSPASIALIRLWSGVNQHPVPGRCPEQRAIALSDIKKM